MLIINIPHASVRIPDTGPYQLGPAELEQEAVITADLFVEELVKDFTALKVIAPVSRLVVDTERFIDDNVEEGAKRGMGVIYTRSFSGKVLRDAPSVAERQKLLQQYYFPHHKKLTQYVQDCLSQEGRALIIDLHSYHFQEAPWLEEKECPQICLGFDNFHKDEALLENMRLNFSHLNYEVAFNKPYAGSVVPLDFYKKNQAVKSVMIEIRKDLYLDNNQKKNANWPKLKKDINKILRECELFYTAQKVA